MPFDRLLAEASMAGIPSPWHLFMQDPTDANASASQVPGQVPQDPTEGLLPLVTAMNAPGKNIRASVKTTQRSPTTVGGTGFKSEQDLFKDLMDRQSGSIDSLQSNLEDFKNQPKKANLLPLLNLTDSWAGTNLSKGYQAPPTPEEQQAMVAKLQGMIGDDQAKMTDQQLNFLNKQSHDAMLSQIRGLASQEKSDKKAQDYFIKMQQAIDPNKASSRTALGVSQDKINTAERIQGLLDSSAAGFKLTPEQTREFATGLARLIAGGGGQISEGQIDRLVPKHLKGDYAGIAQWVTSHPQDAGQSEFIKLFAKTLSREKAIGIEQVKRAQLGNTAAFEFLKQQDPTTFYNVLAQQGIDKEFYDSFVKNGRKAPSLNYEDPGRGKMPSNPAAPTPGGGIPSIDEFFGKK